MVRSVRGAVFVAAAGLAGCEALTEKIQDKKPNPVAPAPVPVVVVVEAVPTPTPTPPPAPAPAPAPSTPSNTSSCHIPAGTGPGTNCPRQQPSYLEQVERAMDQLIRDEPHLFDLKRARGCSNCYFVKDPTGYVNRMAQLMPQFGLCGHYDGEELGVKRTNSFNDQYDILTADMFIRRQLGSYRSTCYPAWF